MGVLERERHPHPVGLDALSDHGTVALVERLRTFPGHTAEEVIARLQANARGSDGGLALADDSAVGGLSEAQVEAGALALEATVER